MGLADLIVELEPKARSEVGTFFGVSETDLRKPIQIRITDEYGGTGWGFEDCIAFNLPGIQRDIEKRRKVGLPYTPEDYMKETVYEEVAHHLEAKYFPNRQRKKLKPFQEILFAEFFGSLGTRISGFLDRDTEFLRKDLGDSQELLRYLMDKEITDCQRVLDSYSDFQSRLSILEQLRLLKQKRIVSGLTALSNRSNEISAYENWRDFYATIYPRREKYIRISGDSYSSIGRPAYLFSRLLVKQMPNDKEYARNLLRLSYPALEEKLTPVLKGLQI